MFEKNKDEKEDTLERIEYFWNLSETCADNLYKIIHGGDTFNLGKDFVSKRDLPIQKTHWESTLRWAVAELKKL